MRTGGKSIRALANPSLTHFLRLHQPHFAATARAAIAQGSPLYHGENHIHHVIVLPSPGLHPSVLPSPAIFGVPRHCVTALLPILKAPFEQFRQNTYGADQR